ncbi:MAG: LLM class flavin-dependent oxidoreductase [Streptosporangiaceae bacterium]
MALIRRGIHPDTHGADDRAAVFGRLAEAARAAEDAGFDAISVPDHVYDPGGPAFPMFEAYTALGALAVAAIERAMPTVHPPGLPVG